jgi:hypothetical protein
LRKSGVGADSVCIPLLIFASILGACGFTGRQDQCCVRHQRCRTSHWLQPGPQRESPGIHIFIFTNPADRIPRHQRGRCAKLVARCRWDARSASRIAAVWAEYRSIWGYVYHRPVHNLVEIGDTFSLVVVSEKFTYRLENENEGIGND